MISDECLNSIQLPRAESTIVSKLQGLDPELTSHPVPFNMDMGRFDAIEAGEENLIGALDTPHARHETDPIRTRSGASPGLGVRRGGSGTGSLQNSRLDHQVSISLAFFEGDFRCLTPTASPAGSENPRTRNPDPASPSRAGS